MPTLVLSPYVGYDSVALRQAARAAGWAVERLSRGQPPDNLHDATDLVFWTEPNYGRLLAARLGWVMLDPADDWLVCLPQVYRLRSVRCMSLAEARRLATPAFLKPADYCGKVFRAAVYDDPARVGEANELPNGLQVLASEPVTWELEFRCFVLDREVTTLSLCYRHGRSNRTANGARPVKIDELLGALAFARRLLADESVNLPPAVVVDIGHIAGRGWAVVEANPAWCSALYGCEASRVLPVLQGACRKKNCVP